MKRRQQNRLYLKPQNAVVIGPRQVTLAVIVLAALALIALAVVGGLSLLRNNRQPAAPPPSETAPPPTATPTTPAPTVTPTVTVTPEPPPSSFEHTVQTGESMFSIAALYGISLEVLAQANNMPEESVLLEGMTLTIPLPPERRGRWHTVQPGETLTGIADAYGVTEGAIQSANLMGESIEIYAGEQLRIPGIPGDDAPTEEPAAETTP